MLGVESNQTPRDLTIVNATNVPKPIGTQFNHVIIKCPNFDDLQRLLLPSLSQSRIKKLTIAIPGGVNELLLATDLLVNGLEEIDVAYKGNDIPLETVQEFCRCASNSLKTLTIRGFSELDREELIKTITSTNQILEKATIKVLDN